jgi:uncharacterized membrane protein
METLMFRPALVTCGFVVLSLAATNPAAADLKLCNNTESRVGVALGYNNTTTWVSEGWWNINPNSCKTILKGDLIARYYYVYAVDYDHAGTWGGKAILCTQDTEFVIEGNTSCTERGYTRQGFFEVDTAEETDWTVSLSGASTTTGQNQ